MSDHTEHACTNCGSLLHFADKCPGKPMSEQTNLSALLDGIEERAKTAPVTEMLGDDGIYRFRPWRDIGRDYEKWIQTSRTDVPALVKALREAQIGFETIESLGATIEPHSSKYANGKLREITSILQALSEPKGEEN